MKPSTQFVWRAEKRCQQFLSRRTAQLEAKGQSQAMLRGAEERRTKELDPICRQLMSQGLPAPPAHDTAGQTVPE